MRIATTCLHCITLLPPTFPRSIIPSHPTLSPPVSTHQGHLFCPDILFKLRRILRSQESFLLHMATSSLSLLLNKRKPASAEYGFFPLYVVICLLNHSHCDWSETVLEFAFPSWLKILNNFSDMYCTFVFFKIYLFNLLHTEHYENNPGCLVELKIQLLCDPATIPQVYTQGTQGAGPQKQPCMSILHSK